MPTQAGRNTRTIAGYLTTLLDYPRWVIEREVDFTDCKHGGSFETADPECASCRFGAACCWLNVNRAAPPPDAPLADLLHALDTAIVYMRSEARETADHSHDCECDACEWLREAMSFLRLHRHRT